MSKNNSEHKIQEICSGSKAVSAKLITLSADAFGEAPDALAIPDISNRPRIGKGFRYSPEEDEYILAVESVFCRAQRECAELKRYVAQRLDRPRSGIENRLLVLKGPAQQRNAGSDDAEGEERSRVGSANGSGDSASSVRFSVSGERPGTHMVRPYTAAENATLCRIYAEYQRRGEPMMRCYEAMATTIDRSLCAVKHRVLRLRASGDLGPWDYTQTAHGSAPASTVVDVRQEEQEGRRSVAAYSDNSDSLHNTGSDADDHRPQSLTNVLSVHLGHDRGLEGTSQLGKRKRLDMPHDAEHRLETLPTDSDNLLRDADQSGSEHEEHARAATAKSPAGAKKSVVRVAAPRLQRLRFTVDEDAALRAGFERLPPDADEAARRELSQRLAVKLSRRAHVVRRRAKLLGCWDGSGDNIKTAPAESRTDVSRTVPAVPYNAGSFTPEEDAIIWESHTQHRTEATTSSSAAAGGAGRDGVLDYVSGLAELLGRSYTQVQRRLDRLRAQDQQATPHK